MHFWTLLDHFNSVHFTCRAPVHNSHLKCTKLNIINPATLTEVLSQSFSVVHHFRHPEKIAGNVLENIQNNFQSSED